MQLTTPIHESKQWINDGKIEGELRLRPHLKDCRSFQAQDNRNPLGSQSGIDFTYKARRVVVQRWSRGPGIDCGATFRRVCRINKQSVSTLGFQQSTHLGRPYARCKERSPPKLNRRGLVRQTCSRPRDTESYDWNTDHHQLQASSLRIDDRQSHLVP